MPNYGAWGAIAQGGDSLMDAYMASKAMRQKQDVEKAKMEMEQAANAAKQAQEAASARKSIADATQTEFENAPSTVSLLMAGRPDPSAGVPLNEKTTIPANATDFSPGVGGEMNPNYKQPLKESVTLPILGPSNSPGKMLTNQEADKWSSDNSALKQSRANQRGQNIDFQRENSLRDEFNKLTAPFQIIRPMYKNIEKSATNPNPSAQSDMSMIFAFMKILDPNSTVREGEYATASNAGSAWDKVGNIYNKLLKGEKLQPEQRVGFFNEAKNIYGNAVNQMKSHKQRYEALAQRAGVDPGMVTYDYTAGDGATQSGGDELAAKQARLEALRAEKAASQVK